MAECSTVVQFPIVHRQPSGINLARQTQIVPLNDRARVIVLPVVRIASSSPSRDAPQAEK
jgi:hypothetical protein